MSDPAFTRPADTQPAFPRDHAHDGHNGMSLRDYFAAKAMQGILAVRLPEQELSTAADYAYAVADAMLKARQS